jgi:acetyl esterase/lipase
LTYSTTTMGATFPRPVDDVACAVRWAAEQATSAGRPPSQVVVLGHSAGGHLGALVALAGDRFGADCPAPPVAVDGFIGLAGVYDVRALGPTLAEFFGATADDDPDTWNQGDPLWWAAQGTSSAANLRVLLVHGDADTTVPLQQSTALAQALKAAGADVTMVVTPGQTHQSIYSSAVARPVITDWLDSWQG